MSNFLKVIIILLSISFLPVKAQEPELPFLLDHLGTSNMGERFYLTFHPCYTTGGSGNSIKIFITSDVATRVKVRNGRGLSIEKQVEPYEMTVFQLQPAEAQCYVKNLYQDAEDEKVWAGAGLEVIAEDPILCYGMVRYSQTSDGYLALPLSVWGQDYRVHSYYDWGNQTTQKFPSYTSIIAAYDQTRVSFTLGGPQGTQTPGGMLLGQSQQFTLNEGDVLLIGSIERYSDLSGSIITSNRPIAVISGNYCARLPEATPGCDYLIEQEFPTTAYGRSYFVPAIRTRESNGFIVVTATEDGTAIRRNGQFFGNVSSTANGTSYFTTRANTGDPSANHFTSDKPMGVTFLNQSRDDDGVNFDPFQMNITATEQFDNEYYFAMPAEASNVDYTKNYLSIVIELDDAFIPEDVEIGRWDGDDYAWKSFSSYDYELKNFPETNYYYATIEIESVGFNRVRADRPFGAYLYGYSTNDSYGYPAFSIVKDLTVPDEAMPLVTWDFDTDMFTGRVDEIGSATEKNGNKIQSHLSHLASVYFLDARSENIEYDADMLVPGSSNIVKWTMRVENRLKDAVGYLYVSDRAGNDSLYQIVYEREQIDLSEVLEFEPDLIDFGKIMKGTDSTATLRIRNKIANAIELPSPYLANGTEVFEVLNSDEMPFTSDITISGNGGYDVIVRFSPEERSEHRDSIMMNIDGAIIKLADITGSAGFPECEVSSVEFDKVIVGDIIQLPFYISNNGDMDLIITDVYGPSSNMLTLSITAEDLPLVVHPGEDKEITVALDANRIVPVNSIVEFASNSGSCSMSITADIIMGIEEAPAELLSVNPTPASNRLIIEGLSTEIRDLKLININGEVLISIDKIENTEAEIPLNEIPSGIYFLQFELDSKKYYRKVVVLK